MADTEQQEGQKTVVAFIAGLLIGGLLVWVFSSSPDASQAPEVGLDDDTETSTGAASNDATNTDADAPSSGSEGGNGRDTNGNNSGSSMSTGNGSLTVPDQAAGSVVVINDVTYPSSDGWIAVRDYEGGVAGNILGAARYSEGQGLHPREINLLRSTEAGMTYQVVFFSENGDRVFGLADDELLTTGATTFITQ